MSERRHFSSGSSWEETAGYSRAVRVGDVIEVSGTTAMSEGQEPSPDLYLQAKAALETIQKALAALGAGLDDVVRTRTFITDMNQAPAALRAHAEAFGTIRPASTLVEVAALIDPRLLVEIDVSAVVEAKRRSS